MSSPAARVWYYIFKENFFASWYTHFQQQGRYKTIHRHVNTSRDKILWKQSHLKTVYPSCLKNTFLGFRYGVSLRSLAPLSPSNLPDNISSQLWKWKLIGLNNGLVWLPEYCGLCIAVWSPLGMILLCPKHKYIVYIMYLYKYLICFVLPFCHTFIFVHP